MPFVIPYFIPHQGCSHQCLFCNQNRITGKSGGSAAAEEEIEKTIAIWSGYRRKNEPTQFAFYGGSFTCLPKERQVAMLEAVRRSGEVDLVRLSTRPDCIDEHTCDVLREYGVAIVELGVQSLDDVVLSTSQRGHDAQDCVAAIAHLKEGGMRTGIQLMPGLPGENRASFLRTVSRTIALQPEFVRIYPALVISNSGLAALYRKGEYRPLSLDMAIILTAKARREFLRAGIQVVRMGLQPSGSLEKSIVAGPYHPAFGELVIAREWLARIRKLLLRFPDKKMRVRISARDLSAFNGLKKRNRLRLQELGLDKRLEVKVDKNMERGSMHYAVSQSA